MGFFGNRRGGNSMVRGFLLLAVMMVVGFPLLARVLSSIIAGVGAFAFALFIVVALAVVIVRAGRRRWTSARNR